MEYVSQRFVFQVIGPAVVGLLFWQLGRSVGAAFLLRWALSAVALVAAHSSLYRVNASRPSPPEILFVAFAFSHLSIFFFWYGVRQFSGKGYRSFQTWVLVVVIGASAFLVTQPSRISVLIHYTILGTHLIGVNRDLLTLSVRRPSIGFSVLRIGVIGLCLILLVQGLILLVFREVTPSIRMVAAVMFLLDAVFEMAIVYAAILLACEQVRRELEDRNQQLMVATQELERVARTDGLTGLLNRRAFDELVAATAQDSNPGCVAVVDLNDLKKLNDTHLHTAGDAALRLVARALVSKFRVTDPILRIGGDEFVVVMVLGNESELTARLESLDLVLRNQRLPGVPEPQDLSVAWGVAGYDHGNGLSAAFQKADQAMYRQKKARKTRTTAE
jgi:diguanylate cyclase (GGDEF)-like protein